MIDWVLVGIGAALFGAGVAVGYFWDDIKRWALYIIERIVSGLNWAIEKFKGAIVWLVRKGYRVYKKVEAYYTRGSSTYRRVEEEEVYDVPAELDHQLNSTPEIKVATCQ